MREVTSKMLAVSASPLFLCLILFSCDGSGGIGERERFEAGKFPPAVFLADKIKNETTELYASFDDGTDVVKLSEDMVFDGNVVAFAVSPNGIYVAYVADQDTNNLFELYVVPVDKTSGESATKVSVALAGRGIRETFTGSGAYHFAWAPDSSRIAYIADAAEPAPDPELVDSFELFSATPDGKEKRLISNLTDGASDVLDFRWEPQSTRIAYVADQDTIGVFELYVSPADGNNPNLSVSGKMAGNGVIEDPIDSGEYAFAWAPDGSRLAYIADQIVFDKFELFTSLPDGGDNLLISELPQNIRDVKDFQWAPNSRRIAYTANQDIAGAFDLFSAPPNVSTTSQKNSSGLGSGQIVSVFKWAPDSSRIAFLSDKLVTGFFCLYSVQPVNNNDILISSGLSLTDDVIEFEWAPDSSRIAYLIDSRSIELLTTLPASRRSTQIKKPLALGGDIFKFEWAPNSSRLAYTADFDAPILIELFSSTPDNKQTDPVSGALVPGKNVGVFKWAPDSSAVGYIANQDSNNLDELYASRPNGDDNALLSNAPVDSNGDPVFISDVSAFEWVPY